jgi:hypothetical protein
MPSFHLQPEHNRRLVKYIISLVLAKSARAVRHCVQFARIRKFHICASVPIRALGSPESRFAGRVLQEPIS